MKKETKYYPESEQEEIMVKAVLKRAETECIKCAMWDEVAQIYGKRGMCAECFDKTFVPINDCNQDGKEF